MSRTGPPSKFNAEIAGKICDAVRAGNYIETAAEYAGIVRSTLYEWMRQGANESEGPYRDFHDALKQALAASEVRDVLVIGKAAAEQWQAAAWRLERRYPEKWGRKERHEHSAPGGGPIQHQAVDPDALAKRIAQISDDPDTKDE